MHFFLLVGDVASNLIGDLIDCSGLVSLILKVISDAFFRVMVRKNAAVQMYGFKTDDKLEMRLLSN